jgi:hypothetical protein
MELGVILSKACARFARRSIRRELHLPCRNRSCWLQTIIEAPCGCELHDTQRRAICSWWSDTATLLPSGRCYGSSTNGFSVGKTNSCSTPMIPHGHTEHRHQLNEHIKAIRAWREAYRRQLGNNSTHPLADQHRGCRLRQLDEIAGPCATASDHRQASQLLGGPRSRAAPCRAQHDAVQEQSSRPH